MNFEQYVAILRNHISPIALGAIHEALALGERSLANSPEGLCLLRLNFAQKARLMALGACYAWDVPADKRDSLVRTFVLFGALFTMIDTAIDEGGVVDRRDCERIARFLIIALQPDTTLGSQTEPYLAALNVELARSLRQLPGYSPALMRKLSQLLQRHASLVTFQHVAVQNRSGLLRELGASSYEALCADGSPGPIFALIRAAALSSVDERKIADIEQLYFPEFGLLHVIADDLADQGLDLGVKDLSLASSGELMLRWLDSYLLRLAPLTTRAEVLFPLQLMFDEYRKAASEADPQPVHTLRIFDAALAKVRQAAMPA